MEWKVRSHFGSRVSRALGAWGRGAGPAAMLGAGVLGSGREREEVVFEFNPPQSPVAQASGAGGRAAAGPGAAAKSEDVDSSATPAREAFDAFARREAGAVEAAAESGARGGRPRRRDYEAFGSKPAAQKFEPPEQRLVRLQAEVAELLQLAEGSAASGSPEEAADQLGIDPAAMSAELKVLEQRLGGLARDAPASWRQAEGDGEQVVGISPMSGSLVSQLQKLATGSAPPAASGGSGDGRVTYELSYAPSTAAIVESSKIAALESSIADIEKQLGVLDPSCPFSDLQSAVTLLQKRVSLLDSKKLDSIRTGVDKEELQGGSGDRDLDRKVSELYEFCHRWSATADSLPTIVARLRSLQAIHQQSASFAARLAALEKQQDELQKLLETTNTAVKELGRGLQENMTIVRDSMTSFEDKMKKALG
ncbi:unnamed protein product [Prorocentrum cordatum]|uniref:Dynactin subunit 2 n=1 Tax=Prorocentrum cordatum TaxID=2364126 RepID=A0ABN9URA0_9DINO|nr:unnamed protein product [Polarella glacialis]